MSWIENRFEEGLLVTSIDWAINWARKSSIWPMTCWNMARLDAAERSLPSHRMKHCQRLYDASVARLEHGYMAGASAQLSLAEDA